MSHFGIDPRAAKEFWNEKTMEPFDFDWKKIDEAMAAAIVHNQRLCEAFLFGSFPSAEEAKEHIDVWAEWQEIRRNNPVSFFKPRKMPNVGTIGYPDEPCLNELTRLMRGYWTHSDIPKWVPPCKIPTTELSISATRPMTSSVVRPEVIEMYKSRRKNPVLLVALEETRNNILDRYIETMDNAKQSSRRF